MAHYEGLGIQFEDFNKICRLCCIASDNLTSIYQSRNEHFDNLWNYVFVASDNTVEMLLNTVGLSVTTGDGLPQSICSECSGKLLSSNDFRNQCQSAAVYLNEILMKHTEFLKIESEAEAASIKDTNDVDAASIEDTNNVDAASMEDTNDVDATSIEDTNNVDAASMEDTNNVDAASIEDTNNFDDSFFVSECLDENDLSPDADVEVTELFPSQEKPIQQTVMLEVVATAKRKRGRPKIVSELPPITKRKNKSSNDEGESSAHKNKKSKSRKDICLICGKIVNHNIKGHQAIHDTSKKYECDICGFHTYVKLYIKNHMKKKHVAQRQYPCPHCHLIFMHAITLKRHGTIHTGEKNHICEECGKSYRQRDMLTAHRKRHLPPTIQCPFCEKLFYSKNELKSHVGLHTGVKAFKCDICTAAFVASSSLAAHRRQHKKDNVLPSCKICGMIFHDRVTYNMHLMDHKRMNQSIAYNNR